MQYRISCALAGWRHSRNLLCRARGVTNSRRGSLAFFCSTCLKGHGFPTSVGSSVTHLALVVELDSEVAARFVITDVSYGKSEAACDPLGAVGFMQVLLIRGCVCLLLVEVSV